jgi:hypothetical protein
MMVGERTTRRAKRPRWRRDVSRLDHRHQSPAAQADPLPWDEAEAEAGMRREEIIGIYDGPLYAGGFRLWTRALLPALKEVGPDGHR